jgi:hypothetical protein
MLTALKGEIVDRLPWVPRLDLWYNAHKRAGTLPAPFQQASLYEITDALDWGFHAVIPQFKNVRSPADECHRALGVYNLSTMPYATVFENVDVTMDSAGDDTCVTYRTPKGTLRTRVRHDEAMRRAGITISHIQEHAIKEPADYAAVAWLFDNARVTPNAEGYARFAAEVGERGCAVGFVSLAGSPMHLLLRELMPFDQFCYELSDHPDELATCATSIGSYYERVFTTVADSAADIFLFGANFDAAITSPPFFEEHIKPWLRKFADLLHRRGKLLLTHPDGENTGLLDSFLDSGMDIADSICPAPMTRLNLRQVREHFAGRISILGGFPSVALLPESMSDRAFEAYVDDFFGQLGTGDRQVLGISDTTPPGADFQRLVALGERARAFRLGCRQEVP